jgi:hypothetical protein
MAHDLFCLAVPLSAASLQKIAVAYVSPSDMIIPGIARDGGILAKNDDRGFFIKGVKTWRESDI